MSSSFLTQSQINTLTGVFDRHFSTFSSGINNFVTVYKEPIQVINNSGGLNLFGYDSDNNGSLTDITYTEVSRQIPCMIISPKDAQTLPFTQIRTNIDQNDLFIKVDQDGADYINNGKNERFVIRGLTYNPQDTPNCQSFFGKLYWYYKCVITK